MDGVTLSLKGLKPHQYYRRFLKHFKFSNVQTTGYWQNMLKYSYRNFQNISIISINFLF